MQTPLRLEAQGTTLSSHVQDLIVGYLRKIEDRYVVPRAVESPMCAIGSKQTLA